jgi:hypothetical protein
MPKLIDPHEAEGDERRKLMRTTLQIVRIMDKEELTSADSMNVLCNLVAEIAIVACVDKESFMQAIEQTYDLHIEHASHNETLN